MAQKSQVPVFGLENIAITVITNREKHGRTIIIDLLYPSAPDVKCSVKKKTGKKESAGEILTHKVLSQPTISSGILCTKYE